MRKRKDKDKLVLKSRFNQHPANVQKRQYTRKPGKTSKTTVFLIIIALIAFVVGAGIGISMALSGEPIVGNSTESYENVTVEMTSNISNVSTDHYVKEPHVDFNSAEDINKYNLTKNDLSY